MKTQDAQLVEIPDSVIEWHQNCVDECQAIIGSTIDIELDTVDGHSVTIAANSSEANWLKTGVVVALARFKTFPFPIRANNEGVIQMMNKPALYDAALAKWGYDAQVLVLAEECSELSASACRFVNHKANGAKLADEAADVEIMLEQLRHNGLACHIDRAKERKLVRLAKRLAMPDDSLLIAEPTSSLALLDEAIYHVGEAQSLRMVGECPVNQPDMPVWRLAV